MEIISAIESWSYPIIELVLLIYCLVKLRNRGGEFLAIAFGILIIMSLSWRIVNIFHFQREYEKIYEVLSHVNLFMYIIYAVFFVLGISKISSLANIKKEIAIQEKMDEKKSTKVNSQQQTTPVPQVNVTVQQPQPKRRIGKQRSVFAPLLLPIVTLGIYTFVWIYKVYTEADIYCEGKVNITSGGAAVGFLFIPFFNLVWAIMLWFKTPGLLTKMQIADGIPENQVKHYGHYGWFNFIPIIGSIIWIILVQSAFNQYWNRVRPS